MANQLDQVHLEQSMTLEQSISNSEVTRMLRQKKPKKSSGIKQLMSRKSTKRSRQVIAQHEISLVQEPSIDSDMIREVASDKEEIHTMPGEQPLIGREPALLPSPMIQKVASPPVAPVYLVHTEGSPPKPDPATSLPQHDGQTLIAKDPVHSFQTDLFLDEARLNFKADPRMAASSIRRLASSVGLRKDSNQEFFTMCLLSFKLNNQDLEEVLELDHRALYQKCVDIDKKEFFEFQDWISKEVQKLRFQNIYKAHQRKLAKQRYKDLETGIKYVDNV